jgi:hypothetical protein
MALNRRSDGFKQIARNFAEWMNDDVRAHKEWFISPALAGETRPR